MTNHCPFCNSALPTLSAAPTADRLACPRCGEPVPASRWRVDTAMAAALPPPTNPVNAVGNRQIALILVSVMVTMAVIGLSYALWTTSLRRSRDPKVLLDPIAIRRPLELQGLGYVPKDSQVLVGLHLSEWLDDKDVGQPLLAEPCPSLLDYVVKQLPRLTGMKLEEIDHVVLAGSFEPARVVIIIRTRRPYVLEKIVETIRPNETGQHLQHPLYHFTLNRPLDDALLWCIEDKTLICVIPLGDPQLDYLKGVPAEQQTVEVAISSPLREAITERLPGRQFLWTVGGLEKLGPMKAMLQLLAEKADLGPIMEVKTFAVGLAPIDGLTMTGHFKMGDAKSAAKLKTRLEAVQIDVAQSQKVEMPPEGREPWVTWQVRGDVAVMRRLLNRGQDAKK